MWPVPGSASSIAQRGDRAASADRLRQVPATDAQHVRYGSTRIVQQAHQLLGTGAGRGDDTHPRAGVVAASGHLRNPGRYR